MESLARCRIARDRGREYVSPTEQRHGCPQHGLVGRAFRALRADSPDAHGAELRVLLVVLPLPHPCGASQPEQRREGRGAVRPVPGAGREAGRHHRRHVQRSASSLQAAAPDADPQALRLRVVRVLPRRQRGRRVLLGGGALLRGADAPRRRALRGPARLRRGLDRLARGRLRDVRRRKVRRPRSRPGQLRSLWSGLPDWNDLLGGRVPLRGRTRVLRRRLHGDGVRPKKTAALAATPARPGGPAPPASAPAATPAFRSRRRCSRS